jgi:hypothetical protein
VFRLLPWANPDGFPHPSVPTGQPGPLSTLCFVDLLLRISAQHSASATTLKQEPIVHRIFFDCDAKKMVLIGGAVVVGLAIIVGITTLIRSKGGLERSAGTMQGLQKAADAGDVQAMYKIGERCYNGDGGARDYTQAMNWYRRSDRGC